MISYYPLEDDEPPPAKVPVPSIVRVQPPPPQSFNIFDGETTECNYIVFAFIIGVLLLALADFMKR